MNGRVFHRIRHAPINFERDLLPIGRPAFTSFAWTFFFHVLLVKDPCVLLVFFVFFLVFSQLFIKHWSKYYIFGQRNIGILVEDIEMLCMKNSRIYKIKQLHLPVDKSMAGFLW